jgi:hypothetical protein
MRPKVVGQPYLMGIFPPTRLPNHHHDFWIYEMKGGWGSVAFCFACILAAVGLIDLYAKGFIHGDTCACSVLLAICAIGFIARFLGWQGMIEHEHDENGCWCEKEF